MSKLSNTLLLLSYLQNGRKYSINELSEKLEVSSRMIRTYKEDLEKSGFIIETIYGPYGGYVLKKNNISISSTFNDNDIKLINNLLQKKNTTEQKEYLYSLLDRIKTIINSKEEKIITNKLQKTYNLLSRAIKDKKKVQIEYLSLNKGNTLRVIHPYELFYLKNSFAVAAFCENKKDLRHFELNRIKKIIILEENY